MDFGDGIEYSRGFGDQCLTCHSRDIGYNRSAGTRFCKSCRRIAALESQLADRDAEIERLRADLVWAVWHGAMKYLGSILWYRPGGSDKEGEIAIDGTPESICRAVRETRDGVR